MGRYSIGDIVHPFFRDYYATDEQWFRYIEYWVKKQNPNASKILNFEATPKIRKLPEGLKLNILRIENTNIKSLPEDLEIHNYIIISKDMAQDFIPYCDKYTIYVRDYLHGSKLLTENYGYDR